MMKFYDLDATGEAVFTKFRDQMRPDSLRFEDNWLYILQACRNQGRLIENNNSLFAMGCKPNGNIPVIANCFGSYEDIPPHTPSENIVIAKNVHPTEVRSLQEIGFRHYHPFEAWDSHSKYDDQSYPQQIADTDAVVAMTGGKFKLLRSEIRRAKTKHPSLRVQPYSVKKHKEKVKQLARCLDEEVHGAYESTAPYFDMEESQNTTPRAFIENENLVGYAMISHISALCCAGNTLIYDQSSQGLSSLIFYSMIEEAQRKGYAFLNSQGSESKSLDRWKRRFHPSIAVRNVHMILER